MIEPATALGELRPIDAVPADGSDTGEARRERRVEPLALPEGVLAVRVGPGANCSSAGSAVDVLFYGSVIVGAIAVALAAAFPPRERRDDDDDGEPAAPPATDHK
ncbi:Hypothetical protein A7982_08261 [Minicystis rosea]|nr:Hypothetical protein A7982_08261 [Minicystis rosea]